MNYIVSYIVSFFPFCVGKFFSPKKFFYGIARPRCVVLSLMKGLILFAFNCPLIQLF
uniref:Uncharacterized protein n=1 Tax=Meloidogyne enterolobii TaxID=390850 RepID=A0A6V7WJ66_MELEN|nr:unnamed protein product [Meloidogyne enterolobii]